MGLEAKCRVKFGKQVSEGKALLETAELIFRGEFRLHIPFADMKSFEARRGNLTVSFPGGTAVFELGPAAEKWALKIRYPRPLIDKLGVKPGSRIVILGVTDADFLTQVTKRVADLAVQKPRKESDLIFLGVDEPRTLGRLVALQKYLKPDGGIWIVYPKGQSHITEAQVMAASKLAGLVDVKVASFSDTHTALKCVIPVARRAGKAAP